MQPDRYPDGWADYSAAVPHVGAEQFGFACGTADVNRFSARFRAAASYRGVILEGYSEATAQGYSALCRTLFTYSAFESFLKITEQSQEDMRERFERSGGNAVVTLIKRIDQNNTFYNFLNERVNARHQRELANYFNDDPCNISYLASAVRHIFAHGWLTPNANQGDPLAAVAICNHLCDFLTQIMDQDFSSRVTAGLDALHGR